MEYKEDREEMEENAEHNFRRPICEDNKTLSNYYYYPINELMSGENSKVFSAIKMVKGKSSDQFELEDRKYCINYISKKWIKNFLITKCNYKEDNVKKFYDAMRNSYNQSKSITNPYILTLFDYIEEPEAIFVVYDCFNLTLYDYLRILKEGNKKTKNSGLVEFKLRHYILKLVTAYFTILHDLSSVSLCGLLNSRDILLSGDNPNDYKMKFQNPFLSNIMTVFKFYSFDEFFPLYYPPEASLMLNDPKFLEKLNDVENLDMTNLHSSINNVNFDIWALGFLLYEMVDTQILFTKDKDKDKDKDNKQIKENSTYLIKPYLITEELFTIIHCCLQYSQKNRLDIKGLRDLITNYEVRDKMIKEDEAMLSAMDQREYRCGINLRTQNFDYWKKAPEKEKKNDSNKNK